MKPNNENTKTQFNLPQLLLYIAENKQDIPTKTIQNIWSHLWS
jgi:hypothetical protein